MPRNHDTLQKIVETPKAWLAEHRGRIVAVPLAVTIGATALAGCGGGDERTAATSHGASVTHTTSTPETSSHTSSHAEKPSSTPPTSQLDIPDASEVSGQATAGEEVLKTRTNDIVKAVLAKFTDGQVPTLEPQHDFNKDATSSLNAEVTSGNSTALVVFGTIDNGQSDNGVSFLLESKDLATSKTSHAGDLITVNYTEGATDMVIAEIQSTHSFKSLVTALSYVKPVGIEVVQAHIKSSDVVNTGVYSMKRAGWESKDSPMSVSAFSADYRTAGVKEEDMAKPIPGTKRDNDGIIPGSPKFKSNLAHVDQVIGDVLTELK